MPVSHLFIVDFCMKKENTLEDRYSTGSRERDNGEVKKA